MNSRTAFVMLVVVLLAAIAECGKIKRRPITASVPAENEVQELADADSSLKTVSVDLDSKTEVTPTNETSATFTITVSSDDTVQGETDLKGETDLMPKPRPGLAYLTQLQSLMSQFLTFFGFRSQVERKNRGLDLAEVEVNDLDLYKDGLKTTLGAVMGKRECFKKVTCRAGKYLKTVRGKEIVLVILEKVTPSSWTETVRMLKESAIHNDKCEYKCLD